ncbi:hypothetical protein OMP40_16035 [Cohnella rhizosphaerae]|uniref:Uncharacterized protein n=1 Tax=Cohnella rhizosphaerae TaxID=1457232 RepID=A0A9X4KZL3_9BACL|nr:hypothetical protein [Cohnella rhizosphaerae]MDG0810712.1 hypothetical protein [Cohnella rhizosphaerae]
MPMSVAAAIASLAQAGMLDESAYSETMAVLLTSEFNHLAIMTAHSARVTGLSGL